LTDIQTLLSLSSVGNMIGDYINMAGFYPLSLGRDNMTSIRLALAAATAALSVAAPLEARTLEVSSGDGAAERLQSALIDAHPGDVVQLGAGRFEIPDSLSLDVANVTVRGKGMGQTVLAFDRQKAGSDGFLITANTVTVEELAIENPKGNGIKSKGVDGITFRKLRVEWTAGPKETNGAYGVYPVSSTHVLIDAVVVKGASDAGIYVGQSREVVVRNSEAQFNVAGIEIENCYNADVHDNLSTHNAGGILVFDLPGLPQMGGHSVRVFHNSVIANDTPNFAPKGNIVAGVPTGTGVMVMANRDVHVFDNLIDNNGSVGVLLVAYLNAFTDPSYNPLPRRVSVHDNKLGRNGFAPAFEGGPLLARIMGGSIPPVVWDGVVNYQIPGGAKVSTTAELAITDGPVVNLQLQDQGKSVTSANPVLVKTLGDAKLAEPPAVVLKGAGGAR
jgi:parallel beta-helix repeat protein